MTRLFGKQLFIWFTMRVIRDILFVYVCFSILASRVGFDRIAAWSVPIFWFYFCCKPYLKKIVFIFIGAPIKLLHIVLMQCLCCVSPFTCFTSACLCFVLLVFLKYLIMGFIQVFFGCNYSCSRRWCFRSFVVWMAIPWLDCARVEAKFLKAT